MHVDSGIGDCLTSVQYFSRKFPNIFTDPRYLWSKSPKTHNLGQSSMSLLTSLRPGYPRISRSFSIPALLPGTTAVSCFYQLPQHLQPLWCPPIAPIAHRSVKVARKAKCARTTWGGTFVTESVSCGITPSVTFPWDDHVYTTPKHSNWRPTEPKSVVIMSGTFTYMIHPLHPPSHGIYHRNKSTICRRLRKAYKRARAEELLEEEAQLEKQQAERNLR